MSDKDILLEVQNLKTHFRTERGPLRAVDGVSFTVRRGETLGIVGESGCGKSVTAKSIMQILPLSQAKIVAGKILYYNERGESVDITTLDPQGPEMRSIRGNEISMIFQEPMTSLNPVYTIGQQIMEAVQLHQKVNRETARDVAIEMLEKVGIPAPAERVDQYPHEFSGGMRQRAMIAMALSCNPKLLIADEPTTALDVTVEAQIINLLLDLQATSRTSVIMITHDLNVIGDMADRVIVMYAGWVVESGTAEDIFYRPQHPYTRGLMHSIPRIGEAKRLVPIKGSVPDLKNLPQGWCYFAPRCEKVETICARKEPPTFRVGDEHFAKCWAVGEKEVVS
ncbi:MAG: ABC transporter ATP-binding protein [Firmicutes bacterium]|nr:ABC transporter ATP-binding protein [Bacillota bacterium]